MPHATADPVIPARSVVITDPDTGAELSTVTATVVTIERREENGILGRMVGLDANLLIQFAGATDAHSYHLSRLVDETYWVQDAHFGPNSYPYFSNGFGARYLKPRLIHAALETLLDEAALARSLATGIGPETPLVLAVQPDDGDAPPPRGAARRGFVAQ
ncbi:hypothetical protein [Alloactinosynnema sp. L-07]|uniref:hypothetical protein n=1 Tax=Alloactinosynnema sp. L-07 TaxID=1653480 RepID=UPI00065F0B55|nr:hypothetical protein [Alloactinosynnema sp. L-07]CRK57056.1 hypothetical protein [Alloactinosynnema sp. L-07]